MDQLGNSWCFHCGDSQSENISEEMKRSAVRKTISCLGSVSVGHTECSEELPL